VYVRPSSNQAVVNPTFNGVHTWTGNGFDALQSASTVKDFVEDSLGRLWYIGEYFSLQYLDGAAWTQLGFVGWGERIARDPSRAGTVWAQSDYEVRRTDGDYSLSLPIESFPGSAAWFTGLAIEPSGAAWFGTWTQFTSTGSTLIRIDPNTNTYSTFNHDDGWPFPGEHVRPLAVTPDGRLWLHYDSEFPSDDAGLCWYDGVHVGSFPAPPGGQPQWGGMPHAGITDFEVHVIASGYELWMSCPSRGLAVLTVETDALLGDLNGDGSVGAADLSILLGAWGACGDPCNADLNGDGAVGAADLSVLLGAWS